MTNLKTTSDNKGFGTGKGTTARIRNYFAAAWSVGSVKEVAATLDLPARQLNKRFAELVKAGYLVSNGRFNGSADYRRP
jgi:hypothetical protein